MSFRIPTSSFRLLVLAQLLAAACGPNASSEARLRATVTRRLTDTTSDTVSFESDAVARHCTDGPGMLLLGTRGPNGVLVLLRPGDSARAGTYTPLSRADTSARRGAVVATRFIVAEIARGGLVDSGVVTARQTGQRWDVSAGGSGMGLPGAVRFTLEAVFTRIAAPVDSASCEVEP